VSSGRLWRPARLVIPGATGPRRRAAPGSLRRITDRPEALAAGPGKQILGELPRAQVSLAEADLGFMSVLRLALADGDGLSLTFPKQDKNAAEALAAALPAAPDRLIAGGAGRQALAASTSGNPNVATSEGSWWNAVTREMPVAVAVSTTTPCARCAPSAPRW